MWQDHSVLKDYSLLLNKVKKNLGEIPLIQWVNQVIQDAIQLRASDIHFEPYEHCYRIRVRVDGLLQTLTWVPIELNAMLASRLKIMAHLDIAERRLPQDGRFKMELKDKEWIEFRVSTCPTLFGEKMVLRILDPTQAKLGIDALGYSTAQKQLVLNALQQPQGMMIVTGPTGSGKTVSLYTALNLLNTGHRNIATVEDPVEIHLPGINQVPIHLKAGLDFATVLRALLRQDPDVMMVGEIRDLETAEIAVKAAQTGHLVLSTLHTNNAVETLLRLEHMGIAPYHLASSVSLIIAQRLVRCLCPHCKQVDTVAESDLVAQGFDAVLSQALTIYTAVGCERCCAGYQGRTGIYEVLPMSEHLQHLILQKASMAEMMKQAEVEGCINLRQAGLAKVALGITSLAELNRVT